MSAIPSLDQLDAKGRRVFLRLDLNVPMSGGAVSDTTRIDRAAPTVSELADAGAKVIIASHFGRPKGKVVPEMSLRPLVTPLSSALGGREVAFCAETVGPETASIIDALPEGGIALLENLRFDAGEEANDAAFADALAGLADVYVNDAFSAAHRAHASIDGIARRLPSYAGRLMEAELTALSKALEAPERPMLAVVGGAKVSTKLDLLGHLVTRADRLLIGGGMANTFLYADGHQIGTSLAERDLADTAREIRAKAEAAGCTIILQTDAVVADRFAADANTRVVPVSSVPEDHMILDIGPATAEAVIASLSDVRTVCWNGPLGAFETPPFEAGTVAVARAWQSGRKQAPWCRSRVGAIRSQPSTWRRSPIASATYRRRVALSWSGWKDVSSQASPSWKSNRKDVCG